MADFIQNYLPLEVLKQIEIAYNHFQKLLWQHHKNKVRSIKIGVGVIVLRCLGAFNKRNKN